MKQAKELVIKSIYLEKDLSELIEEESKRQMRSFSSQVAIILRDWAEGQKVDTGRVA